MSMIYVGLKQGDPEWLQFRATHYGASDAPAMMGCSSYKSRSALIAEKATGIAPEPDAAALARFAEGHRIEALARPIAERVLEAELFPVVGALPDSRISASFDGLTLDETTAWECKTLNQRLADVMPQGRIGDGRALPEEYRAQMSQQQLVSGAQKTLFTAAKFDANGSPLDVRHCWYERDEALATRIVAGWAQFDKDLDAYVPVEQPVPAVATARESLPAVSVKVDGVLAVASNLDAFGVALREYIERMPAMLETDQQFADAEADCKVLRKAEDALRAAESGALAQITDVEAMRRVVSDLAELARSTRIRTEKLVKAEKQNRKTAIVHAASVALDMHVAALDKRLSGYMPPQQGDWMAAVKGKSSLANIQSAVDDELARCKIAANQIADGIDANLKRLSAARSEWPQLFPDVHALVLKAADDLDATMAARIAQAKEAERQRLERERARIEAAAKAKAEAEARAVAEAERARIRAEEETKARAAAAGEREIAERNKPMLAVTPIPPKSTELKPATPLVSRLSDKPTLNLSAINKRLTPISISCAGLSQFGIEPLATDKAARLYSEEQYRTLLRYLADHINELCYSPRETEAA